jgi:hypothetical protein
VRGRFDAIMRRFPVFATYLGVSGHDEQLSDGTRAAVEQDIAVAQRDGQVRLWWDETPVDLFFAYHRFHHEAAEYARAVPFGEREIPVLDCTHLAVLKALFGRPRDWVDIEAMATAESWEPDDALRWVADLLGTGSDAYRNLARVAGQVSDEHADDAYRRAFGRPRDVSNEE